MNDIRQINIEKLKEIVNGDKTKKAELRERLGGRGIVSKVLNGSRAMFAGELLIIADLYEVDPRIFRA